mmetsp:Transcript_43922/g.129343  ORF Transcript_43922/g.129343 Transcript_43922/m.129343 type:complete len:222 (-) Transcript_43922:1176-1841(-)
MSALRLIRILHRSGMPSRAAKSSGLQSPYDCDDLRRISACGLPLPELDSAHELASSSSAKKMRSVAGMSLRGTESAILVLVTPHMEPIVLVSGLSTMSTRSCAASSPISPFSRMSAVMITCVRLKMWHRNSTSVCSKPIERRSSVATLLFTSSHAASSSVRWWLLRLGLKPLNEPCSSGNRSSTCTGSLIPSRMTVFLSPSDMPTAREKFSSSLYHLGEKE